MLILDGDGIDRRNSHDGQIKTRLEAFLEMLETGEEAEENRPGRKNKEAADRHLPEEEREEAC